MRPRLSHLLLALVLAACAGQPVPPATPAASPAGTSERDALAPAVADLSSKAEALLRAQDELVWKHWTEGVPADLAKTYVGTEGWLTPEAVGKVGRLRALTTDGRERRGLDHLHAYLAGEWMAQQLAEVSDAIAALEQSLTFKVAGTDRPYRNLESILGAEKSALRRRQIYEAATPAVEKVSALLERRGARAAELLPALNLEPAAWTTELREASPDQLGALADTVLTRTQDAWTAALTRLAQRELQLPLDRIGRQDLPRLVRLPPTEGFKRAEVVPRVRSTLGPLQLDPAALTSVTLDAGDAPRKNPRGLVLGVVVPTDVRISLRPVGGARDQRSALHEFGHAVHDAFTEERRFELAKLGNRTNAEAFAALLESLTTEPAWLEQAGLSPDASRPWVQGVAVQELFLVRRAAGKVLFNLAAGRPGADAHTAYRTTMDRAYGLPGTALDEARNTLDQEATLGAADYLRGWLLGAQLRAALVRKFGANWWQDPNAGAFLKPLLAPGNGLDANGLARALGDPGVSPDAFVATVLPRLSGTSSDAPRPAPAGRSPASEPAATPAVPPASAPTPGTAPFSAASAVAPETVPAAGRAELAPGTSDAGTARQEPVPPRRELSP
ncbi:MAG TPA: chromosome segregation protein SMC [Myxococcaceae bacterium]|nr:chromosome segregation protein SMC [Myxococcaceae bacterium]